MRPRKVRLNQNRADQPRPGHVGSAQVGQLQDGAAQIDLAQDQPLLLATGPVDTGLGPVAALGERRGRFEDEDQEEEEPQAQLNLACLHDRPAQYGRRRLNVDPVCGFLMPEHGSSHNDLPQSRQIEGPAAMTGLGFGYRGEVAERPQCYWGNSGMLS